MNETMKIDWTFSMSSQNFLYISSGCHCNYHSWLLSSLQLLQNSIHSLQAQGIILLLPPLIYASDVGNGMTQRLSSFLLVYQLNIHFMLLSSLCKQMDIKAKPEKKKASWEREQSNQFCYWKGTVEWKCLESKDTFLFSSCLLCLYAVLCKLTRWKACWNDAYPNEVCALMLIG